MSRSVRSSLLAGGLLAVLAFLLVDHGSHLGASITKVAFLGVLLGGVLGYVPDRNPLWRAGGFAWGFALAWLGYALRAGVLPDIPLAKALVAAAVIVLVVGAVGLSGARMPLWAGLLGIATMVGAYEFTFTANPVAFKSESATAASAAFVAAALGFLVGVAVGESSRAVAPSEETGPSTPAGAAAGLPVQAVPGTAADSGISIVTAEAQTEADSR